MEITWGHTTNGRAETPTVWLQRHTQHSGFLWKKSLQGYARNGILVFNTPHSLFLLPPILPTPRPHHTAQRRGGRWGGLQQPTSIWYLSLLPSLLATPKLSMWVFLWHRYVCDKSQIGFICFCFQFSLFPSSDLFHSLYCKFLEGENNCFHFSHHLSLYQEWWWPGCKTSYLLIISETPKIHQTF